MKYDTSGRSEGEATVYYDNQTSAEKAVKDFDNRLFDDMPMKVEFQGKKEPKSSQILSRLGHRVQDRLGPRSKETRRRPQKTFQVSQTALDDDIDKYMAGEVAHVKENRAIISYEDVVQDASAMDMM